MTSKPYKRYTKEFKLEALRLAEQSEKPVTAIARELGLRVNQIYKWKQQLENNGADAFPGQGRQAGLPQDEIAALTADRVKLLAAGGAEETVVDIPFSSGVSRTLQGLKSPTLLGPVSLIFASLGLSGAHEEYANALHNEQGTALASLISAHVGVVAGGFDAIAGAAHTTRYIPRLSPTAEVLSGRFFAFATVGGAAAGAVAGWILAVVDSLKFVDVANKGGVVE